MPKKLSTMVFSIVLAVLLALVAVCAPKRLLAAPPDEMDFLNKEERLWLEAHDGGIRFAPSPTYAPVCFCDADGRFQGITMDYARRMAATLGFRFEIVVCESWDEIIEKARTREIDVIGNIQRTEKRAKYLLFTEPYLTIPNAIITRKDVGRSLSLETMSGMRVAAVEGYATVEYIEKNLPKIDLMLVRDNLEGLQAVSFGRTDAMVTDLAIASHTINHYGITNLKMTGTVPEFTWHLSFASRRDWPILNRILSKGLKAVSAVERQKIRQRWISIEGTTPLYRDKRFYGAVGITLLFGLLVSLVWTRSLHRLVSKRTNELHQSEMRYRSISEDMPVLICRFLPDSELTYVNKAYSKYFGKSAETLLGSSFLSLIPKEDHGRVMKALSTLTAESPTQSHEHKAHTPDGEIHWQRWTNRALFNAGGKVVAFQSIGEDITEWKRNRERLSYVIQGINVGTWEWNVQTGETIFNERWADIIGYTLDEISPVSIDTWMKFCHPDDLKESNRLLQACFDGRAEYYDCESRIRHKNDKWIWVLDRGKVITWTQDGKPEWMYGTHQDTTERKQAEEEHEKLREQLSQAQKMEAVGRLAGGVAHDFNNMLAVILGNTEMAMEYLDPNQSVHTHLKEIKKAGERSTNLVRQLLAFARKQTVSPKVLDLNTTVAGMIKMLTRLIGEDIDLAWIPGERMWPVKIDPGQIDQILANLCVNARDAIAGVGKMTIETGNTTFDEAYCAVHANFMPGEYAMLAVSDSGCGMDAKILANVFEPFFTTKGQDKGTGLGLSTVYGVVKQNQGFINVYSEPGQGTTFKIYLPHHRAKVDPLQDQRPEIPTGHGHETILLVEDEPSILKVTMQMLKRKGYTLIAARSPGDAIELAHTYSGEIHLLMTDVVMPKMNGRDLAKNMSNHYPNLKCLFMSGYTANVIAHHGVLDEGVNFIQKPFSMGELFVKVRGVLDGE